VTDTLHECIAHTAHKPSTRFRLWFSLRARGRGPYSVVEILAASLLAATPPGHEEQSGCHRTAVARLVLEEAGRRNIGVEIQEWPGGEPSHDLRISLPSGALKRMDRGVKSIPLDDGASLSIVAGIPWYSDVEFVSDSGDASARRVLTGPAKHSKSDGWWLPILGGTPDPNESLEDLRRRARELRVKQGFDVRSV
jgi:hypothetical protein